MVPTTDGGRVFGDAAALSALGALPGPYLPWGSGAMRPAGLVLVCNDVVLNERRRIVELGSGVSTVLLARLLAQRSATAALLAAIEHDPRWARWVAGQVAREAVGDGVVIVEAPLLDHSTADERLGWYDEAAVAAGLVSVFGGEPIDLLIVDGPPAFAVGHGMSRYPALPVLRERLAPGATVVLDDIERPGEQLVLDRWEREFGLTFDRRLAGVAMATVDS